MPVIRRLVSISSLSFVISSCASYTEKMQEVQLLYRSGQYEEALQRLDDSKLQSDKDSRFLYYLERGSIYDRLGREKLAQQDWKTADRIGDELYSVSVSKQALSLVTSDAYTDYAGEDYERVAIHTSLALSFIQQQQLSSALVEARRINTKLNAINSEYDQETKNTYSEDALARYLSGIIHESQENWDSAIVDYQKALEVYNSIYKKDFATPVPDSLVLALLKLYKKRGRNDRYHKLLSEFADLKNQHEEQIKNNYGEIVVIHEVGHIARKTRSELVFTWGNQIVRMSFPKIILHPRRFAKTGLEMMQTKNFIAGEKAQDMDVIAAKTLDERGTRIFLKNAARIAAKGQINKEAKRQFGELGGLAVNIFNVITETADTRSWASLPASYYISRVSLPEGEHKMRILTDGVTEQIKTVKITKGKMTILRAYNPPTAKP